MAIKKKKNSKTTLSTIAGDDSTNTVNKPGDKFVTLNLSVDPAFRKDLKMYAAENDTDMVKIVKAAVSYFLDNGYTTYDGSEPK